MDWNDGGMYVRVVKQLLVHRIFEPYYVHYIIERKAIKPTNLFRIESVGGWMEGEKCCCFYSTLEFYSVFFN